MHCLLRIALIGSAGLFVGACGWLNTEIMMPPIAQPALTVPAENITMPTVTFTPTDEPIPPSTPVPSTVCTPNTDWLTYVVAPGDTLFAIAQRTDSTVNALVAANCLAERDRIFSGQVLYVPNLPVERGHPAVEQPIIDGGNTLRDVCAVIPISFEAPIWGSGDGPGSVAVLRGPARLIRVADNAYIIELPGFIFEGWVSNSETQLTGPNCPGSQPQPVPDTLPRVGIEDLTPSEGCFVVARFRDVPVFYGPGDAFAPIALFNGYAPFVEQVSNGYVFFMFGFDFNGWVTTENAYLSGNACS